MQYNFSSSSCHKIFIFIFRILLLQRSSFSWMVFGTYFTWLKEELSMWSRCGYCMCCTNHIHYLICLLFLRSSELRAHVLTAFQELMEHGIVTWDLINNVFVKKVIFTKQLLWTWLNTKHLCIFASSVLDFLKNTYSNSLT